MVSIDEATLPSSRPSMFLIAGRAECPGCGKHLTSGEYWSPKVDRSGISYAICDRCAELTTESLLKKINGWRAHGAQPRVSP